MNRLTRWTRPLLPLACAALVAACGGGSGTAAAPAFPAAPEAGPNDAATSPDPDPASGSLSLAWVAPHTNDDGTPLVDLAGYRIYYGSRSGSYAHAVAVDDPAALSHRLESLAPGTYYVIVKAVNRVGAQSMASPEVSKTIR